VRGPVSWTSLGNAFKSERIRARGRQEEAKKRKRLKKKTSHGAVVVAASATRAAPEPL
jgi:hypothetical protein